MSNSTLKSITAHVNNTELKLFTLIIIASVSLLGNVFFIFVIFYGKWLARRRTSKTYYFLTYISFTNAGVALFVLPFPIISLVSGEWILGDGMCYFNAIMNTFWLSMCVYSVTLLSIHKYFSIVTPLKRYSTTRQIIYRIIASLTLTLAVTFVPLFNHEVVFTPVIGLCVIDLTSQKYFYVPFLMVFIYLIPMAINLLCHTRIYISLTKHDKRMRCTSFYDTDSIRTQKKFVNTLHLVFLSFLFSWTPFFIYAITYLIEYKTNSFLAIAYLAGFSNCAQNPLIFIVRNVRIKEIWSLICRRKNPPKLSIVSAVSRSNLCFEDRRPSLFVLTANEETCESVDPISTLKYTLFEI